MLWIRPSEPYGIIVLRKDCLVDSYGIIVLRKDCLIEGTVCGGVVRWPSVLVHEGQIITFTDQYTSQGKMLYSYSA